MALVYFCTLTPPPPPPLPSSPPHAHPSLTVNLLVCGVGARSPLPRAQTSPPPPYTVSQPTSLWIEDENCGGGGWLRGQALPQSTYIYRAPQWMSPCRNWNSPTPLAAASVPSPPRTIGWGGAHLPAAKGVGESQFRRLEKKLSTLPTLWALPSENNSLYQEHRRDLMLLSL